VGAEAPASAPPRGAGLGRRAQALEAAATGAWLGLAQVTLGFALLAGVGASAAMFFALLGAWLAGGVAGALAGRRERGVLLGAALVAIVAARGVLSQWPFSGAGAWVGLGAGALAGAYAARFLRDRAAAGWDVRALLLHENNGFLTGFVAGAALLFVSARVLDVAVVVGGVGLCAWGIRERG
jgi:hypothetical protein